MRILASCPRGGEKECNQMIQKYLSGVDGKLHTKYIVNVHSPRGTYALNTYALKQCLSLRYGTFESDQ